MDHVVSWIADGSLLCLAACAHAAGSRATTMSTRAATGWKCKFLVDARAATGW